MTPKKLLNNKWDSNFSYSETNKIMLKDSIWLLMVCISIILSLINFNYSLFTSKMLSSTSITWILLIAFFTTQLSLGICIKTWIHHTRKYLRIISQFLEHNSSIVVYSAYSMSICLKSQIWISPTPSSSEQENKPSLFLFIPTQ